MPGVYRASPIWVDTDCREAKNGQTSTEQNKVEDLSVNLNSDAFKSEDKTRVAKF